MKTDKHMTASNLEAINKSKLKKRLLIRQEIKEALISNLNDWFILF